MVNEIYNLPKLNFIGGESQRLRFRLVARGGEDFNANGCIMSFSIISYLNKNGVPLVVKGVTLEMGVNDIPNVAVVELLPEDTVGKHGRYVYQLSIRDTRDEIELPGQGLIDIVRNIHKSFTTY